MKGQFLIGVDVGFGLTKAVGNRFEKVVFPSAIGELVDHRLGASALEPPGSLNGQIVVQRPDLGTSYRATVGEEAVVLSGTAWQERSRWRSDEDVTLLTAKALSLSKASGDVRMVVGLPVDLYRQERIKALNELMSGKWIIGTLPLDVSRVITLPQGGGAFYDLLLSRQGQVKDESLKTARVAVVDIGFYTTDVILIDALRYVARWSFTVERGVSQVAEAVARHLSLEHDFDLEPFKAAEYVRTGSIFIRGQEVDLRPVIESAVLTQAHAIKAQLNSRLAQVDNLERVYIVGGGVYLFHEHLTESGAYGTARPMLDGGEWANARGYRKLCAYYWPN